MKFKKKSNKSLLSDKIVNVLSVKPRADIEDDEVFGTKPCTVSRVDFSSSEDEDDAAISDFRRRNVNLLSEINKKYEGRVVSRKDLDDSEGNSSEESQIKLNDLSLTINNKSSLTQLYSSEDPPKNKLLRANQANSDFIDSDSSDGVESDDYSISRFGNQGKDDAIDGSEDNDSDDEQGYDISQLDVPIKEDFEHVKKQNVSEEVNKGNCVRNQLLLWEGLLEMRIHLQRCMNTANQMPMPDTFKKLKIDKTFSDECTKTKNNVTNVLNKLLSLQSILLKKYPETQSISSHKLENKQNCKTKLEIVDGDEEIPSDTDNEEIPSDTDAEDGNKDQNKSHKTNTTDNNQPMKKRKLENYERELEKTHKAFKTFRDSTIQKWNDKTRIASASIKNTPTNTILQQISYILTDKNKLIRRTQLKRSEFEIVGYKKQSYDNDNTDHNGTDPNPVTKDRKDNDEYIPEIFDDSDFYHQLLRELIECKSADISDPVQLSRQWIALQQMRSKMKRKVDTKATKGRKIKYVVHNPLVNFMAPEKSMTWNEESTNELYSSLFGKMFEQNNMGLK